MRSLFTCAALTAASIFGSSAGAVTFDQNITPDVIFGDGNANGAWTVDQSTGVELGLRAKLRFNESNLP